MSSDTYTYKRVGMYNTDYLRMQRTAAHHSEPWKFINRSPLRLEIYRYIDTVQSGYGPAVTSAGAARICSLPPGDSFSASADESGNPLRQGDYIQVSMNAQPILQPYALAGDLKNVLVAGVGFDDVASDPNHKFLYAPIPGVKFYNHFPFPIDVYYRSNRVVHLPPNEPFVPGMTYNAYYDNHRMLAGGFPRGNYAVPEAYFDNNREGLFIGEKFTFVIPGTGKELYTTVIPHIDIHNIHLGVVNGSEGSHVL